jgi:hypothetical protein
MRGPQFLNEVWTKSATVWDPAIKKCRAAVTVLKEVFAALPKHKCRVFCSPTKKDVFASGYCFDSYFLNCKESLGYEPEVFDRFTGRAVTQTWPMENHAEWPKGGTEFYSLPGLACRYFRFLPTRKAAKLVVRVTGRPGHSLKAELALATGDPLTLSPGSRCLGKSTQAANGTLVCELPKFSARSCHHAVLVVTNCKVAKSQGPQQPPGGYRTTVKFTVQAELM